MASPLTCANDATPAMFKGNLHPSRNYAAVKQHPRFLLSLQLSQPKVQSSTLPFLSHLDCPRVRLCTDELCQQKEKDRSMPERQEMIHWKTQICGHKCDQMGKNTAPNNQSTAVVYWQHLTTARCVCFQKNTTLKIFNTIADSYSSF